MFDVRRALGAFAVALVFTGAAGGQTAPRIPAFPGAEGYGAFTQGGRGGKVLFVTNLEDYDANERPIPGSLRAAIEEEGARTILFRTSGNIALTRNLKITNPYVTIAGQSAPGEGVALTRYGIDVAAPEVVIRYLRVRPGDVSGEELDAINVRSSNVIIDHCSASWATDETLSVIGDATDVTVQWCLISESLNESVHSKGAHGYGSLISTSGRVSIHHNAYAFHRSRNPRPRNGLLDFRNNVIYGWGDRAGYNEDDRTRMNYVANYLRPLPYSGSDDHAFILGGSDSRLYLEGNVFWGEDGATIDDWAMVRPPDNLKPTKLEEVVGVEMPFAAPSVTTHSALEVLELVHEHAGATLPIRDAVDRRVVELMRSGQGEIIDSQANVGGWPSLALATPPADTDDDGMPNEWEDKHGLDPSSANDHARDQDGDGYTNLEEFLNDTDPCTSFGWVPPPTIQPKSGTAFTAKPLAVTMSPSEPGLPIYYTVDGSEPTRDSPAYDAPLEITADAHVRAKSIRDHRPTTAAYATYNHLPWIEPAAIKPDDASDGLDYAVYTAEDWDEGPDVRTLHPSVRGVSAAVDFSLHGDGVSGVVFDGLIRIPQDGIYSFHLLDDARSQLWIAGQFVTNGRPRGTEPGRVALRKGLHEFELHSLHEEPREATLKLSGPGIELEPIAPFRLQRRDR